MAVGIVDRQKLVNIADAVRAKKGITGEMTLDAIASNITSIPTADNNAKFDFSVSKSSGNLLSYLTTVDLSGLDTSNYTNMNSMFSSFTSLKSLDLSNLDTSKVTNMGSMFSNCPSLTSLDLSGFNTSKVTNMYKMFYGCSSIETLDLSNFDFSNMSSGDYNGINSLVYDCMNLKTIIFPSTVSFKNTGINLSSMFFRCSSLTSLDLSGFDTTNVNKMPYLFYNCSSLTSLDLSNWNTSKVTNMYSMFSSCSSLTSLDLSGFDTSNITDMKNMFYGCSSLTTLDLSNWNTSKVTNMGDMFTFCSKLSNLTLGNDWASNSSISSFDLSYSPLTHESAVDVINKLAPRSNSPVITFRSEVGLYQSEIDIATNKGWSVSGCTVLVDS